MKAVNPLARFPVGVVIERRRAVTQWIDFVWQPVAVLPGRPEASPWTVLSTDGDRTSFYAGSAEIEFYRSETARYRDNLASGQPNLWVAMRRTGVDPSYEIVAVTADPAEGESFTQSGNDIVEAVPMPNVVREFVAAFVAEHHVEQSLFRRQRDRADPEALARRGLINKAQDR